MSILFNPVKAVEYLHSCGVVHCDLKPTNLLMTADGTLKIADFDISLDTTQRRSKRSTLALHVGGTHGYMAPELLKGAPCSAESDMYSLGKVRHPQRNPREIDSDLTTRNPDPCPSPTHTHTALLCGGVC